jgi:DNA-binding ferritin-like protein
MPLSWKEDSLSEHTTTQTTMAGSLEQITQNLAALDQQVEALKDRFHAVYTGYLAALGKAVRQQIVLSGYQISTENYPQRFLALSLGQRQQFQDDLRELADLTQQDITCLLRSLLPPSDDELLDLDAELEIDDELEALLEDMPDLDAEAPPSPLEELTQWQANLERAIVKTLQGTAQSANRLLQHAKILPERLSTPVLDVVKEGAEDNASLLRMLVEAREKSGDKGDAEVALSAMIQAVSVNLRLAEIEFDDATVMGWRNKLRELKKQLQQLAKDYQKQQREQAIAQARLAWNTTWVNEPPQMEDN